MLIGLSIDKCVLDIAKDKVHMDDVLVIISKEDFNVDTSISFDKLWIRNTQPNLINLLKPLWHELDRDKVYDIIDTLYFDGKIHCQPQWAHSTKHKRVEPYTWMEAIVPPGDDNPSATQAYNDYKLISDLTNGDK